MREVIFVAMIRLFLARMARKNKPIPPIRA